MYVIEKFDIAGYCRISVDEEQDRDNTSIENQKAIIKNYVEQKFPGSTLTLFEDRDKSGYTFEQREGYQKMRKGLISHKYDILIVKDFSRFSRRNSKGLVELEDLRDYGVRIISIGDSVDFPNDDNWLMIRFRFLINEIPVTDASKKVKDVVKRKQKEGEWICAAPYGYRITPKKQFEIVPTEADIVRRIFSLYLDGWGYRKIANHLTDEGIPTPRMSEQMRREAEGLESKRVVKRAWAIVTIQGILENDFYIGTFRQAKYKRAKINGKDLKVDPSDHIVIENHHQAIIDYRTFATVRELMRSRSTNHYRGQKKYDNVYSGFLFCGDCGSPMMAMSRSDLKPAYRCGTYHRRGLKGCTSHHIRVDKLDEVLKAYVRLVRDNSSEMLERLNADLQKQDDDLEETERSAANLEDTLESLQEELKATKRQRLRDITKHPEREQMYEEIYDEMEDDLERRIAGIQNQIDLTIDKQNTIVRVNRAAKTAMEVFDDILNKEKLDRNDLQLIIEKIQVYEDHIEVFLKNDIDTLLRCGTLPAEKEDAVNFPDGMKDIAQFAVNQSSMNHTDKVLHVNVVSNGDPLEIYTDKDGGVIFKKYSPVGELSVFAGQICEALQKAAGGVAAVYDRDAVIAVAGAPKRELMDKRLSPELEALMELRGVYRAEANVPPVPAVRNDDRYSVSVAAPILAEGDVLGCVAFLAGEDTPPAGETEEKLAAATAGFLGRQMES